MTKKTWKARGLSYAGELALANVKDLLKIISWNEDHGIHLFRISSELFPWSSEYEIEDLPQYEEIKNVLMWCGRDARRSHQRLSFHPGPFNVLASPKEEVVEATIKELTTHGKIFDKMGMPSTPQAKINIHVGGAYGNRDQALERFCRVYTRLPETVRSRLTVENDDRPSLFSTRMLYNGVYRRVGCPIVFDSHHHALGPQDVSYSEAIAMAVETWPKGIRPTCHHSNSRTLEDKGAKERAHSDWYYTKFDTCGHDVDVMLESKMKELALVRYREI